MFLSSDLLRMYLAFASMTCYCYVHECSELTDPICPWLTWLSFSQWQNSSGLATDAGSKHTPNDNADSCNATSQICLHFADALTEQHVMSHVQVCMQQQACMQQASSIARHGMISAAGHVMRLTTMHNSCSQASVIQ